MYNIKLIIAYCGTSYTGWQNSIEKELEKALQQILQHEVKLQAASRTDAGVHAEGQVVNFFTFKTLCLHRLMYSLNSLLPKEISTLSIEQMPQDFHPTLDSQKKEYWYHLCNGFAQIPFFRDTSWHFSYPLDITLMEKAAQHLLGTHDFSSFCNERPLWDRNPICHLEKIEILALPHQRYRLAITGDHFLYKMVRNIAGTLAYVGCGKLLSDAIPTILASKNRTQAGVTAPACGLTLKRVFYDFSK